MTESTRLLRLQEDDIHPLPWFGSPVQPRHRCSVDSTCRHAMPDKDRGGGQAFRVILGVLCCITIFFLILVNVSPRNILEGLVIKDHHAVCDGTVDQEARFYQFKNEFIFSWFFHARYGANAKDLIFNIGNTISRNGPCHFASKNSIALQYNPYSFTEYAHMVYIDFPIGVGYSYSNETQHTVELSDFIKKWLEDHPSFRHLSLYLMGQGASVPLIVQTAHILDPLIKGIVLGTSCSYLSNDEDIQQHSTFFNLQRTRQALHIGKNVPYWSFEALSDVSYNTTDVVNMINGVGQPNMTALVYFGENETISTLKSSSKKWELVQLKNNTPRTMFDLLYNFLKR